MRNAFIQQEAGPLTIERSSRLGVRVWVTSGVALGVAAAAVIAASHVLARSADQAATAPPPSVTVSAPLQREVDTRVQFLGQFSAVERVELRAQVGGRLTQIAFKDGDIVNKRDFLFVIDPTPYQIKLSEAEAQLESAHSRLDLAISELIRAKTLKRTGAGTTENAEQRTSEQQSAQAAVDYAAALVRDALRTLSREMSSGVRRNASSPCAITWKVRPR
jgi:multidrug efflux pump subunit AcrA (membrane-fusion protein)